MTRGDRAETGGRGSVGVRPSRGASRAGEDEAVLQRRRRARGLRDGHGRSDEEIRDRFDS